MDPGRLAAFTAVAFALVVIPGPSVLFVIGRGMAFGRRAAIATVFGNTAGVYVQVIALALGLSAIIQRSETVFTAIKLAGAAYLVVLGVRAIRSRRALAFAVEAALPPRPLARTAWEGFLVGLTNPKATIFFATILPQFVDPARGHTTFQLLVLGLVFAVVALVSDSTWGIAAGSARERLGRSPRRLARLGAAGGLTMIGLGLGLALTGRRS
ncbi:MAG TPA: LysE family translocator [Gaiellales bacterium]|jgi:threonine/homoserine/homoserine lactone efflux protein|nr:LysE family translocator [Gaiellales bacterium]